MSRSARSPSASKSPKNEFSHSPFLPGCIYPSTYFETGDIFMAPDTQSINCNATFLTLGPALSHPFDTLIDTPIDDPRYADKKTLSAATQRVDLHDDDD